MKFLTSQLIYLMRKEGNRRNLAVLFRFLVVLLALITTYSVLFHYIMMWEGEKYSWVTGFYWTLTVMSTTGFGDITFHSDLGRIFSILVLISGIVFLLILLPFTFIQFFYAPWLEAQTEMRTPREIPASTQGHIVLTNLDPVSSSLILKLDNFEYEYVLIEPDPDRANRLADQGYRVVIGEVDNPDSWHRVRADRAALVVASHDDMINSNIAFTVREIAPNVPVVATCNSSSSVDILMLAGATRVLQLGEMMGKALARCTVGGDAIAHIVGNVDKLLIAEANTTRTPMVGKTLREARLNEIGVNVAGVWDRGKFTYATADTVVGEHSILVLAGSAENFQQYNERYIIYNLSGKPAVILGGGRVGRAASRALGARGIQSCIVEQVPGRVADSMNSIIGNAADRETMDAAGLMEAPAVLITTHDDSLNIYLTIYCRSLRPDIQIISRATLERNVATLHRAGADFVLSYASMGATSIFNLIKRSRIVTITEGLEVFRTIVNETLGGKSIAECGIREKTGCTIVAVNHQKEMRINPPPDTILETGQELVLVGDVESEHQFLERYGVD